jgi:hypothetical protein
VLRPTKARSARVALVMFRRRLAVEMSLPSLVKARRTDRGRADWALEAFMKHQKQGAIEDKALFMVQE